jgi:predicted NUDIX family NTP pyrophosphohydrolase
MIRIKFIVSILYLSLQCYGQCVQNSLQAVDYEEAKCGDKYMQSLQGSITTAYGQCGELNFLPPLLGGDIRTSLDWLPLSQDIQVFPNPVYDRLTIVSPPNAFNKLALYNSLGQVIFASGVQSELDMTTIKSGIYVLVFTDRNGKTILNNKVIKL